MKKETHRLVTAALIYGRMRAAGIGHSIAILNTRDIMEGQSSSSTKVLLLVEAQDFLWDWQHPDE